MYRNLHCQSRDNVDVSHSQSTYDKSNPSFNLILSKEIFYFYEQGDCIYVKLKKDVLGL